MILQASTWNAVRRSRRASKKGETPCPVMPDKRKILCQDNSKSDTNSPASRRERLGKHAKGDRRDGGLKMGWAKPLSQGVAYGY